MSDRGKHTIESTPFDNYLYIIIWGEWMPDNSDAIIDEIFNLIVVHGKPSLLIDIRKMTGGSSVVEDFNDAKRFFELEFWRLNKIAVLDKIDRKKENDFFETAAANRGVRFIFFYEDKQEAIDWLYK